MERSVESKNELKKNKEGTNLVGSPTFIELENGRLRCVETGHEVLDKDKESYSRSKRCRLGLIDHALSIGKPPLDMFTQHPLSRSNLLCKLTGDSVNKSEEHIWKHVNGRRFLNKLEKMETGMRFNVKAVETSGSKPRGDTQPGVMKKRGKDATHIVSRVRDESDSDDAEPDFWIPPGGGDTSSSSDSGEESVEGIGTADGDIEDLEEISERTKRMSIEIGPSSFASRKKKGRKDTS